MNSPKEKTLLSLDYAEITIPEIFSSHGKFRKHQEAVVCGSVRRTWGDFNDNMNRVANALLASGVARGDRVVVMMGNSVEILEVMFGIVKAGCCVVPLSGLLTGQQLGKGQTLSRFESPANRFAVGFYFCHLETVRDVFKIVHIHRLGLSRCPETEGIETSLGVLREEFS